MKIKSYIKRAFTFLFKGIPTYKVYPTISTIGSSKLLDGRVALITGATSGIGLAIAHSFLKSGASVVLVGRNEEKLLKTKESLSCLYGKDKVFAAQFDMCKVSEFSQKIDDLLSRLNEKKIDILVNNAGVLGCQLSKPDEKIYDSSLDTNLKGPFFLSEIVGKYMKENKIQGNILNILSSSAFRPASCSYTISKWGMRGFTLGLAKSLIPYGIVVNGIAPGPTSTPLVRNNNDEDLSLPNNPLGRYATPEEIANMATIMVSNMCRTVVGDILCMTGGAGLITYDDINYNF